MPDDALRAAARKILTSADSVRIVGDGTRTERKWSLSPVFDELRAALESKGTAVPDTSETVTVYELWERDRHGKMRPTRRWCVSPLGVEYDLPLSIPTESPPPTTFPFTLDPT